MAVHQFRTEKNMKYVTSCSSSSWLQDAISHLSSENSMEQQIELDPTRIGAQNKEAIAFLKRKRDAFTMNSQVFRDCPSCSAPLSMDCLRCSFCRFEYRNSSPPESAAVVRLREELGFVYLSTLIRHALQMGLRIMMTETKMKNSSTTTMTTNSQQKENWMKRAIHALLEDPSHTEWCLINYKLDYSVGIPEKQDSLFIWASYCLATRRSDQAIKDIIQCISSLLNAYYRAYSTRREDVIQLLLPGDNPETIGADIVTSVQNTIHRYTKLAIWMLLQQTCQLKFSFRNVLKLMLDQSSDPMITALEFELKKLPFPVDYCSVQLLFHSCVQQMFGVQLAIPMESTKEDKAILYYFCQLVVSQQQQQSEPVSKNSFFSQTTQTD